MSITPHPCSSPGRTPGPLLLHARATSAVRFPADAARTSIWAALAARRTSEDLGEGMQADAQRSQAQASSSGGRAGRSRSGQPWQHDDGRGGGPHSPNRAQAHERAARHTLQRAARGRRTRTRTRPRHVCMFAWVPVCTVAAGLQHSTVFFFLFCGTVASLYVACWNWSCWRSRHACVRLLTRSRARSLRSQTPNERPEPLLWNQDPGPAHHPVCTLCCVAAAQTGLAEGTCSTDAGGTLCTARGTGYVVRGRLV